MSRFQGECPIIEHNKAGYDKRYTYAELPQITKVVSPILSKFNLSYRWEQKSDGANITIACIVTHIDGHSERMELTGETDKSGGKNSIQGVGSTVTYLRRYTLTGLLGIGTAEADTDAATPPKELPLLHPKHEKWSGAVQALADSAATIPAIKKKYNLSPTNEKLLIDEAARI